MTSLSGLVIAVTGAGRGIGRAIVEQLMEHGAKVAALDLTLGCSCSDANSVFQSDLVIEIHCDVASENSVRQAFQTIVDKFGQIDGLVNNAGICLEKPLMETTMEDFDRVIGVNLRGTFLCGKIAVSHFFNTDTNGTTTPPRRIVNIASEIGHSGMANYSAYTASKGGIYSLTRSWALELAPHNILVNAVAPGPTDTPMLQSETNYDNWKRGVGIPLGRLATPTDIAKAVCFLLGPDSTFITGSVVDVNGGAVMY